VDGVCFPANRESVAEVGRRVVALGREAGLGPDESYRLRLATEEIVANVVAHGYESDGPDRPDGCPTFEVQWGSDPQRVWVCVVDSARPFDPTAAAPPDDLDAPLDERSPGGLGIHLVRTSLDEFRYRREGRHNHVTLAVRRERTAEDGPAEDGPEGDGPAGTGPEGKGGRDGTDGPDSG
jgi:serine/threonine-protein kinase RsbW/sigma-B regulation protein RsbU (phosphoserine phosphatase)